ncbi:MAG: adenylate/guanylate cyclase domain-containing protein [Stellaceae bacterium]
MAERAERRLTTILAADIAEYSRLMRADEDATMRALGACRAVIDALVAEHRGRIANTAGDAVLAEFPSLADGLACALAMQQAIAAENADMPADRRMEFRVGVHLGDVMTRDGDLFGDAVNIAARLEALAEPGGICVSAAVREHVGTRIAAHFTDIGTQQVKNIAEPIHVFRVGPTSPLPTPPPLAGEGSARVGAAEPQAPPLPDKSSIAVLPFANMSNDPEQEFFADGIAEDVITALLRYPSLFVIARNSCFTYKGRAVDVKQVGRELGVRYVLEGSLRKSGNRIRVTAQLVEAETGNHLWAERYDRDLADIFAVQDEITEAVTIAVAPAVAEAERQRAMRKPPENLDAWAAYQRGMWHLEKVSPKDNQRAAQLFQQAIDLDPSFAGGYVGLATARVSASVTSQTLSIAEAQRSAEALARRAVALDPASAEGGACLSAILRWRGDLEGARAEAERVLALSPNLALAHITSGAALIFSGRPKEGLEAAETALRLDPRNPMRAFDLLLIVIGHYFCRDYQATVEAARHAIRAYPDFAFSYRWLAAALGQLGRAEEAKEALEKAVASAPATFDKYVLNRVPWHRPEDHAHMLDGLRKAGWEG